jgi:pimeloyl-ACP methyl ester carboxylesterase
MPKSKRAAYDGRILPRERDLQLDLSQAAWPAGCPLGEEGENPPAGAEPWQQHDGYLYRTIAPKQQPLWEAMLRFPSAPIYGLHQSAARFPRIEGRSNFHTFRVIGALPDSPDDQGLPRRRVRDVYVLHNGLNETGDSDLHYQLASRLLVHSKRPAVCILRPFPGHLTRYPYNDIYAEQPLDTYLLDSGDLFRQFVRFMIETRWLLSILVPRSSYKVITGGTLVPGDQLDEGKKLAENIVREWEEMDTASITMDDSMPRHARRPQADPQDVSVPAVQTMIEVLRKDLLRWRPVLGSRIPEAAEDEPPAIHMVGYSLGGFVAQSAFFAWPYAISGCVTLFGGGELRKLAPTAFAQPEEWQSVLHALRYELDRAMSGTLMAEDGMVRGIPQETFEYLLRVFYEVFLQYYQGSYRTRLAEFIQRMMFVAGGQDPIVRPGNVLEAAPQEGANIITIAGMSHFPTKPKERVQREQREFWLEQLGRIVPAFAEQADERRLDVLERGWLNDERDELHEDAIVAYSEYGKDLDDVGGPPSEETSGASLSDRWFGKEIERICDFIAADAKGWVLVSRNEVPPVFQTAEALKRYAAGLHHSEDLAADEFWLASQRRAALEAGRERVTLMLTQVALDTGFEESASIFPPRSETPGVPRLSREQREAAERHFETVWRRPSPKAVRVLYPGEFEPHQLGDIGLAVAELQKSRFGGEQTAIDVHFLPDVWIGIKADLLKELERRAGVPDQLRGSRTGAETAIVAWAAGLAENNDSKTDLLKRRLEKREISIVKFSRAGLNPRHRGQLVNTSKKAAGVLIHWALAYKAARVPRRGEKKPFV